MDCDSLYLFCDGPKMHPERTLEVRKILSAAADHRTRIGKKTALLFRDINLGTQKGPTFAIREFFSHEEEGHIIEDDIVVHPLFFDVHAKALIECRCRGWLWVGEGHPLPNCASKLIETKLNRLAAWSSWREPIQMALACADTRKPWEEKGLALLRGLHPKTQIFLWKEFERLKRNPNWSWAYKWQQFQLESGLRGLTPTTRLHKNLGVDGSGHNCQNVFGAVESWTDDEIYQYQAKPDAVIRDHFSETLMETQRYGRGWQSIGRKLMRITPPRWRWIWRPVTSDDIASTATTRCALDQTN